jgi:hypothetical protein
MNREKIKMNEYLPKEELEKDYANVSVLYEDVENPPFDFVEEKSIGYDAEKNVVEYELILKRHSDSKYFKVEYSQYSYLGSSIKIEYGMQVFPKQITTIIYE